jgi:2-hydroxy-3-oxopropionate reductase
MAEKIGFVGLGIMGRPMSKNLLKAKYDLTVYDIVQAAVDDVGAAGAKKGASAKDVASKTDIIITMLPDGPDVEKVVLGPNGVLEGARKGAIVVDMSSISPIVAQKVGKACNDKGVEFLDAPVSGGEPGAINATLAIMVGGKQAIFDKVKAILEKMGSSVTLTGDVGAGNVTKLANQIMVAVNIAGVAEALVLATKAGLDPEVVFNAVKVGLAGSNVLNAKGPMMIARNFKPGFRIRLHQKDLRNTLQTAEALGIPLPITAYCQQMFNALMNEGKGDNDHSGLVQYLEKAASVTVKKPQG